MAHSRYRAKYIAFVFSTGECGVATISTCGAEAYVKTAMEGTETWHGGQAHDLNRVPEMALTLLKKLQAEGWGFSTPGVLSQSWRQHDMALVDNTGEPLIPALSWQCDKSNGKELQQLKHVDGFEDDVGPVEARFVAAKLVWALNQDTTLKSRLSRVMSSGDWFAGRLTGGSNWTLSTSDALSNGLLCQRTRQLAITALRRASERLAGHLEPKWFPPVIASDGIIGLVSTAHQSPWRELTDILHGWCVAGCLGDNHATAAGCGAAEHHVIVISLGHSGTINLPAPNGTDPNNEKILRFEYWDDQLFLLMLGRCASWYNLFKHNYVQDRTYDDLNHMAQDGIFKNIVRVYEPQGEFDRADESYRWHELDNLEPNVQVASTQYSIAVELLRLTNQMLDATIAPIQQFVLTGGLSQAPLIRSVLHKGLFMLANMHSKVATHVQVMQNDRHGNLAFKTDALGALFNAMMVDRGQLAADFIAAHRKWSSCEEPNDRLKARLTELLSSADLGLKSDFT